jgi:hypothetical protein
VLALEYGSNGSTTAERMLQPIGVAALALGCLLLLLTVIDVNDTIARIRYMWR